MKIFAKLLMLLPLLCLSSSAALAQKKVARTARHAPTTICKVTSVPKGMVIVGYKTNAACAERIEVLVKHPAASETVCADSPVPDGYSVSGVTGSLACTSGDSNTLTNAMSITNDTASPVAVRATVAPRASASADRYASVSLGNAVQKRADELNAAADRANAADKGKIMVGMTMTQVEKALGSQHSVRRVTQSGVGTESSWVYSFSPTRDLYLDFDTDNKLSSFRYIQTSSEPR